MKQTTTNLIRSFIIIPLVASSVSMNAFTASVNDAIEARTAVVIEENLISPEEAKLEEERKLKAAKIDAYFTKYNMPLKGSGMVMVLSAEDAGLDWRLLPAIAVRESTGCKHYIRNTFNCFGWGGGKIKFQSHEHAIKTVGAHLGGKVPGRTASYYGGKSIKGILQTYNPPSVVPTYANEVMSIMTKIENMKV